ncbi:MAG: aspartate ammonia-lyase [unclassified Hahellaceae]|nr:aspartate ammonia-lyase [Hahellaceae bacterium]|tara:strand:- start:85147 stop:86574 length:1428 start_codon:yes stop_codon:yes gene_type:complete
MSGDTGDKGNLPLDGNSGSQAKGFRSEHDSLGEVRVPQKALWAAQTQRAVDNFPMSHRRLPDAFIQAVLEIKKAAAQANDELGELDAKRSRAIVNAVDKLLNDDNLLDHFPVDIFQTGSGTSTNMNANEVIAHLANAIGDDEIHPNDHVNRGQSSNDVIPSAIQVSAACYLHRYTLPALTHSIQVLNQRSESLEAVIKTGRTHLMDAMPVSLGQTLGAWAAQMADNRDRLNDMLAQLLALPQGGTAVGTGINAHDSFAETFNKMLGQNTGLPFRRANNLFSRISAQDTAVALSGQLKTCAVSLMKIANDLRWMNSGPLAGLGEIQLEALQPGSSIMPGKVNPVIPEAVAMASAQVIGNDATITIAGQSGNFELNVMLPVIADNLLYSLQLITNSCQLLTDKAIATFKVNHEQLEKALASNPILVTALNPVIGYEAAATIAKQAYKEKRPVLDVAVEQTDMSRKELKALLDPAKLV